MTGLLGSLSVLVVRVMEEADCVWWWSDLHILAEFHPLVLQDCCSGAPLTPISLCMLLLWCRLKLIFLVAISMMSCCHHQRVMQSSDVYWRPGLFPILIWCTGKVSLTSWQGQMIEWKALIDLKVPPAFHPHNISLFFWVLSFLFPLKNDSVDYCKFKS